MAEKIVSSHIEVTKSDILMVPQQRPLMPVHIFNAAIKGDTDYLARCLGLEEREEVKVTVRASQSAPQQTEEEHEIVQFELGSTTRFGETLLHLLIIGWHNKLALKVFTKDMSLLKAHNNKLETPLHEAAKVGNEEVIRDLIKLSPSVVKDALRETNEIGDTAFHMAANLDHEVAVIELMKLDPEAAYKINKQGLSPLYIAIVEGHTSLVKAMLQVDTTLACTRFSDGTFPVHVAARMGNADIVEYFLRIYPDYAKFLDSCGRNLIHHMAAEENHPMELTKVLALTKVNLPQISQTVESMINARDYEGNTPLHIAAMMGHKSVMIAIWDKLNHEKAALLQNRKGKTAFHLSYKLLWDTHEADRRHLKDYIEENGFCFTQKWFDGVMSRYSNKLERTQIIGLGSVLITTVAFAAAFTVPGGYNNDNGAPILGKRFMFRAFILANTLAFIEAFQSLFAVVSKALYNPEDIDLQYALYKFLSAASCMVIAFGLGSYVMLAPINLPIAIIILVVALLLGSPTLFFVLSVDLGLFKRCFYYSLVVTVLGGQTIPLLFIFCLAFL